MAVDEDIEYATANLYEWVQNNESVYMDIFGTIEYVVDMYKDKDIVIDTVRTKVGEFFINGLTPDGEELDNVDWVEFIEVMLEK